MEYYLATTGLFKSWDLESNKLLLLGPWCFVGAENKNLLRNRSYIVCPSPWKNAFKIKEAADYCQEIYESLIPQLSENLNLIHQIDLPIKYWRILLGHWLLHFINIFYDRYRRIESVYAMFPEFYTYVLHKEKCNYAAFDVWDFFRNCKDDDCFNLKLFSIICNELCPKNTIEKEIRLESKILIQKYSMKRKLFYHFLRLFDLFSKNPIVLSEMYHLTPKDIFLLKVKSRFKAISFIDFEPTLKKALTNNYSLDIRNKLTLRGASDRFQKLLYKIIPSVTPKCYLENYRIYRESIRRIKSAHIIGSAIGWHFNERFKFYAAESVLYGAKIIEFLHGGNYGFSFSALHEAIPLEKDIFYCWGWAHASNAKIKNLPSIHLSKIKDTYSYKINKILFIGQLAPKYMLRFHTMLKSDDIPEYFEDKEKFFLNLSVEFIDRILYRPYPSNAIWGEIQAVKKMIPKARFLLGTCLIDWMKKVKLVIIDHPHTSFLEALAINVPCVFYWDHDIYVMRDEAEGYFELLRTAGILYRDPESAANKVNEIYDNPSLWWQDSRVQTARQEFCNHYALARQDWLDVWTKELKLLLNGQ